MIGAMKERAWSRASAALLLAAAGACAAPPDVHLVPAVQDTDLRGEAGDLQARVVVAWRGIARPDGPAELVFRLRIENPGPAAFTLVPAEFELLDAGLFSFGPAHTTELPVLVEPGQSATIDLVFRVPAEARLEDYDLSTLTLGLRLQGGRWNWTKTFERVAPYATPSPWSFSFGVGWVAH